MLFGTSSRSLWNEATRSSTNHSHKSNILWSRVSHDFDNVMLWAAPCLGFWGFRRSCLCDNSGKIGCERSLIKTLELRHLCYTSELHGSNLHGYHPCLVSRNSLGTTGRPPINYSGCLDICVYIFCMCGCPFKVRSIHIFGAMNGLVAMGMGGWVACRIGLGCVALRHWRLSVLTFTPLLRSLKRASVIIHLVRVAGIRNSGSHVTYSFRHAGACCQAKKCQG